MLLRICAAGSAGNKAAANNSAAAKTPGEANSAASAPTNSATGAAPSQQRVELAADGIFYRDPDGGALKKLGFGADQQEATGLLVMITSESTEYFPANRAGCSTTSFGETQGYFQGDRFVGYSTGSRDLKTAAGIGVGSTRAALEAAYDPQFEQMEDGGFDFTFSGMRGEIQGEGASAAVVEFAAGEICGR